MIEEYNELHSMMLERADHISKVFSEADALAQLGWRAEGVLE